MQTGSTTSHVDFGVDKASDKARLDRVVAVGALAPETEAYKTDPAFKQTIDEYVDAGDDFVAKQEKVTKIEAALAVARDDRDESRNDLDRCHGAAAKQVEKHAVSPSEIKLHGFTALDPAKHGLVSPTDVALRYDLLLALIRIHVKYATPGTHYCVIEISPSPVGPGTWVRLEGTGVKRALSGYAPGTWWVRVATTQAHARGEWVGPFSVIVT